MTEEEIEKQVGALIQSRITFRPGEHATHFVDAGILNVIVARRFDVASVDAYVFKRPVSAGLNWLEGKINFALKVLREAE